jgi:hypothetical protein
MLELRVHDASRHRRLSNKKPPHANLQPIRELKHLLRGYPPSEPLPSDQSADCARVHAGSDSECLLSAAFRTA